MSATIHVPAAARREARELLAALSDFSTATDALSRLLETLGDADERGNDQRFSVIAQVIYWQNVPAVVALHDVVADFDLDADADVTVTSTMVLTAMGKPALLFAASIYDDSLAELVWTGLLTLRRRWGSAVGLVRQALDNVSDSHGFSALHYALEAQMDALMLRMWRDLIQVEGAPTMGRLLARVVTQDVALPVAKQQIQGRNIGSGGATLLHFAARVGSTVELVRALLESDQETLATQVDWDGCSPLRVARMNGNQELVALLKEAAGSRESDNNEDVAILKASRDESARVRYISSLEPSPGCLEPHIFPALWTREECERVLAEVERTAGTRGWDKQRHTSYPTTDMPSYRVIQLDSWVRAVIANRLFPLIASHFTLPASPGAASVRQISFRELFFVKYEARAGERAELALHRDGSVLSFNILLNPAEEFTGGGTFFEDSGRTVHITQGDAVVHSGKVRHAGAPVLSGRRMILVAFLDVVDRVEWP